MNRENLQKLADGLRGQLAAEFGMSTFCFVDGDEPEDLAAVPQSCGAVACAIGHATYLVSPKHVDECFFGYATRAFGLDAYGDTENSSAWQWCFSSDWENPDNTPAGAADRIEWMLRHGLPADAIDQRKGRAPLCYRPGEAKK